MIITAISDTHGQHKSILDKYLPGGDCIIHAGDVSYRGTYNEIESFMSWFNERFNIDYSPFCCRLYGMRRGLNKSKIIKKNIKN
jgi:predicted phosphodiesterase